MANLGISQLFQAVMSIEYFLYTEKLPTSMTGCDVSYNTC